MKFFLPFLFALSAIAQPLTDLTTLDAPEGLSLVFNVALPPSPVAVDGINVHYGSCFSAYPTVFYPGFVQTFPVDATIVLSNLPARPIFLSTCFFTTNTGRVIEIGSRSNGAPIYVTNFVDEQEWTWPRAVLDARFNQPWVTVDAWFGVARVICYGQQGKHYRCFSGDVVAQTNLIGEANGWNDLMEFTEPAQTNGARFFRVDVGLP